MNLCWWHHKKEKRNQIAHVVQSSGRILGMEIYTAYCGQRTIHNDRKQYGRVEDAVEEGGKICRECWDSLPYEVLMEVNHLPVIERLRKKD